MSLRIAPAVADAFPNMVVIAVVARGLNNAKPNPEVDRLWTRAWRDASAAAAYGNSQSHPRVRPWREAFQALGVSGKQYPSSIEALLRRAMKGGDPFRLNPVVDFYNAVSLLHTVPAGAFDLSRLAAGLDLRPTREGDTFQALDDPAPAPVVPGEIAYATGATVLTRHFVWRQAREALVVPATRDVLFVSEVLGALEAGVMDAVEDQLLRGLDALFGVTARAERLTETALTMEW